jgi:hypothetical protein
MGSDAQMLMSIPIDESKMLDRELTLLLKVLS